MKGFELDTPEKIAIAKTVFNNDFLSFAAYFFYVNTGEVMKINWHHKVLCKILEKVYNGELGNTIINISPGGSKSVFLSRLFPAWCFAKQPHSRFLLTSYSDDLVEAHSVAIKDIISSREFQKIYPGYGFKQDSNKKAEWILQYNGNNAGEFSAFSIMGSLTGRRAGYMESGFTGCIIVDDPIKPIDALSKAKREQCNATLYNTLTSRKAHSSIPVVMIMQRLHDEDPTGFLMTTGALEGWTQISIPALIDQETLDKFPDFIKEEAIPYIKKDIDTYGSASYWEFKEKRDGLIKLSEIDSNVFKAQYQQEPCPEGGILIQKEWIQKYSSLPEKLTNFRITADTAISSKKHADNSVFILSAESGGNLYILDLIKGKWEMPQLQQNAINFVYKYKANYPKTLFKGLFIEYKASGQGLVQILRDNTKLPIIDVVPQGDKVLRVQQCLPYLQGKRIHVPENAIWVDDFLDELARFSPTMSHKHDDQVDALVYAIFESYVNVRKAVLKNVYYL